MSAPDKGALPTNAVNSAASGHDGRAVHDGDSLVEAIAQRVAELLKPELGAASTSRLVDAAGLAEVLNVSVDFVYAHASELGAIPLTDGDRPRLRFDVEAAISALSARSAGARSQIPDLRAVAPKRPGTRRGGSGASGDLLPIKGRRAA